MVKLSGKPVTPLYLKSLTERVREFKMMFQTRDKERKRVECEYWWCDKQRPATSLTRKKSPNVDKSCPKMISLEK